MTSLEVIKPEEVKIDLVSYQAYSIEAERIAQIISVTDDEEERLAISSVARISGFTKEAEEYRKKCVAPFVAIKTRIDGMFKPMNTGFESATRTIKDKILVFQREKQKLLQAEQARRDREYQEKMEAARKVAAEQKTELAIVEVPLPVLPPANTTKSENGSSTLRKTWKAELTDPMELVKAIAEGKAPIEAVEFKQSFLNSEARRWKKEKVYPGVRFFEDTDLSIRQ